MLTKQNYWNTPESVTSYIRQSEEDSVMLASYLVKALEKLINKGYTLKTDLLLDLACGPGIITNLMIETFGFKGAHVIDLSEPMLDVVPWYVDLEKVKTSMQKGDLTDCIFKLSDNVVDISMSFLSLSYLPALDNVFKESARVLKQNGILMFDLSIHNESKPEIIPFLEPGWPITCYAFPFDSVLSLAKGYGFTLEIKDPLGTFPGIVDINVIHHILAFRKL